MGFLQKRKIKFRDFDFETQTIRHFDLDSYDRYNHDCYGNVTQFALKQDTNGNDIYEGDILSEKWKCTVYVDEQTGAFMVRFGLNPKNNKPKTLHQYLNDRFLAGTSETDCLIVGNVYLTESEE